MQELDVEPALLSLFCSELNGQRIAQGLSQLKSYRDDLAIMQKLAKQDPSNAGWQSDLAYSYWFTGKTLAQSDPHSQKEARSIIEKGREILRQFKERTGLAIQQQGWLDTIEADLQEMQKKK